LWYVVRTLVLISEAVPATVAHTGPKATDDIRVQLVNHRDGQRSYLVLDVASGSVHNRADKFLSSFCEGTQRTYAYHLVDHLRWLAVNGYRENSITIQDLLRYLALCGSQHYGPLGIPWRASPLGESAQAVRATCLKGYYLDLTTRENVNDKLRAALSTRRLPNDRARDWSMLGHLATSIASNPLSHGVPPRKHPRMLPDGTCAAMLGAVRTARDRMIVTWLSDSGMRIGELCGLWFCDLHLRKDHPCGERKGPHAHVVKRLNPNRASAKRGLPATVVDGIVSGGTVRRASPAMVASYHEYLAEDYHRVRALAQTDLVLVQLVGERTGDALSTHGARQMIERAGRRAGLGLIKPHAFRHTWATALTEATGGNTKAVADEGGWMSARTVETTYAHLAGDPALEAALNEIWGEQA
jgi:integrase